MTGWIVLGVNLAGFTLAYRKVYLAIESDENYRSTDGFEKVMTVTAAMIAALLWPLVFVGIFFYKFATPQTPQQRQEELDARERHIKELERELGIGRF